MCLLIRRNASAHSRIHTAIVYATHTNDAWAQRLSAVLTTELRHQDHVAWVFDIEVCWVNNLISIDAAFSREVEP